MRSPFWNCCVAHAIFVPLILADNNLIPIANYFDMRPAFIAVSKDRRLQPILRHTPHRQSIGGQKGMNFFSGRTSLDFGSVAAVEAICVFAGRSPASPRRGLGESEAETDLARKRPISPIIRYEICCVMIAKQVAK